MGLHVTPIFLLILLFMLFSASLFPIAIMTAVSAVSFRVIHIGSLMLLVNKLLDYSKYPVKIYGPVLQFIFTFLFPLAYIAYYPSIPIIRQCEVNAFVILTPVFGVVCMFSAYKFWITGALKYNGTGS